MEFNSNGDLLATGDKGGRVVIFQRAKVISCLFLKACRASVSGHMDVIYVRILLPYAEKFDSGHMTYVQLLSVTSA